MPHGLAPPGGEFRNHILAALPHDEVDLLRPLLIDVPLRMGQVLYLRGDAVPNVYFLERGVASLMTETPDGTQVEVAMTGREGFVGLAAFLSQRAIAVHHACIQAEGSAKCLKLPALYAARSACVQLNELCSTYIRAVMLQSGQAGVCNARHSLVERLANWLLMLHDRVDGEEIVLTHRLLGKMLGVRRAGVTLAANALEARGAIRKWRGRIAVLDRTQLEAASCGCYRVIQDISQHLLA